MVRPIRLSVAAAARARRLEAALGGRDPDEPALRRIVEDAQVQGSLELARIDLEPGAVARARAPGATGPAAALHRAREVAPPDAPLDVPLLLAWHAELVGPGSGFRTGTPPRSGSPPAPPEFISARLEALVEWSSVNSSRDLSPSQIGTLVLARLVEILPFDDANGRVARLAASHVMVRAGGRPPILVGADAERLRAALGHAFQLATEPLVDLLDEASQRGQEVLVQALESTRAPVR